jgi:hypothetical protein
MLFYLLDPHTYVFEGLLPGAVICKYYSLGTLVVRLCDCSKPFLASSVPNLQFHILVIQRQVLYLEIDAYKIPNENSYQWWQCGRRHQKVAQ